MAKLRRNKEFKNNKVIDIETARQERRERRKLSADGKQRKTKPVRQEPSRRQVMKNVRRRAVYSLILIIIAVIIGTSVYNVVSLKIEEAAAQERLDALNAEKEALEEKLSIVDSEEYIEQQAREELRMIMPGETLYVLREKEKAEDEASD